ADLRDVADELAELLLPGKLLVELLETALKLADLSENGGKDRRLRLVRPKIALLGLNLQAQIADPLARHAVAEEVKPAEEQQHRGREAPLRFGAPIDFPLEWPHGLF